MILLLTFDATDFHLKNSQNYIFLFDTIIVFHVKFANLSDYPFPFKLNALFSTTRYHWTIISYLRRILRGQCNQQKNNENSRSNKLFPKITKWQLNFLGHVICNKANGMHSITRKNWWRKHKIYEQNISPKLKQRELILQRQFSAGLKVVDVGENCTQGTYKIIR